jgi:hypothetical protein
MPVIEVHTHVLDRAWLELRRCHDEPRCERVIASDGGATRGSNAEHTFKLWG